MKLSMSANFRVLKNNGAGEYVSLKAIDLLSIGIGGFCFEVDQKKIPFDWTAYTGDWDELSKCFCFSTGYGWMNDFELDSCYDEDYAEIGIRREDISAKMLASTHHIDEFYVDFEVEGKTDIKLCGIGDNTAKDSIYKLELLSLCLEDVETEERFEVDPRVLEAFNKGERLVSLEAVLADATGRSETSAAADKLSEEQSIGLD